MFGLENEFEEHEEKFEPRESISSRGGLGQFGRPSENKRNTEYVYYYSNFNFSYRQSQPMQKGTSAKKEPKTYVEEPVREGKLVKIILLLLDYSLILF